VPLLVHRSDLKRTSIGYYSKISISGGESTPPLGPCNRCSTGAPQFEHPIGRIPAPSGV